MTDLPTHEHLADTEARHAHRDLLAEKAAEIERLTALLEADTKADLSERMVAAGMVPLDAIVKPNCLTKFHVHSGMTDLAFFAEWLERKAREYGSLQAAHQSGVREMEDDMFNFVMGKSGAFKEALENFRAAHRGARNALD